MAIRAKEHAGGEVEHVMKVPAEHAAGVPMEVDEPEEWLEEVDEMLKEPGNEMGQSMMDTSDYEKPVGPKKRSGASERKVIRNDEKGEDGMTTTSTKRDSGTIADRVAEGRLNDATLFRSSDYATRCRPSSADTGDNDDESVKATRRRSSIDTGPVAGASVESSDKDDDSVKASRGLSSDDATCCRTSIDTGPAAGASVESSNEDDDSVKASRRHSGNDGQSNQRFPFDSLFHAATLDHAANILHDDDIAVEETERTGLVEGSNTSADNVDIDESAEVMFVATVPAPSAYTGGRAAKSQNMSLSPAVRDELLFLLDDVNVVEQRYIEEFTSLLRTHGCGYNAIFSIMGETVKGKTLGRIRDSDWVDDIAMSIYIKALRYRESHLRLTLGDAHEKCNFCHSFVYKRLKEDGAESISRWFRENIFELRRMIWFIYEEPIHWKTIVVDMETRHVTCYDPMGGSGAEEVSNIMQFLRHEELRQPGCKGMRWRHIQWSAPFINQQKDQDSCGPVTCAYANLLSQGHGVESIQPTEHSPELRNHVGAVIVCLHRSRS